MGTTTEKIPERSMGGLMKIRLLALVLAATAIFSQGAFAQATGSFGLNGQIDLFKISGDPVVVSPKDFLSFLANGGSGGGNGGAPSMWQCIVEERDGWDKFNDTLDIVSKGILGYQALYNSQYRSRLEYNYLTHVADLNNSYKIIEAGLFYSTQQQIAQYQYKYGSMYNNGGYAYGGGYGSPAIRGYARDLYSGYTDSYWNNWI